MIRLYNAALRAAGPIARGVLAISPSRRPLLDRFDPPLPAFRRPPVWIHACSVGEVNLAAPFLTILSESVPFDAMLLTVSTQSGRARAQETLRGIVPVAWFPFDHPRTVRSFFERLQPRALILIETELWPNVLREAARRSVPVALVNGRISDKHLRRYRFARPLFAPLLSKLSLAAMQNDEFARRIVALGAPPSMVSVTGSMKFDSVPDPPAPDDVAALRLQSGISPGAPVVVFGSTRPGDEAIARRCWDRCKDSIPGLHLIVAPRHPSRAREALSAFAGERVLLRSEVSGGTRRAQGERIHLIDTLGELTAFYSLARLAVVGGSFSPSVQGHNPIEPASLGVAVVFGPHMRNFEDAAALLVRNGGAVQREALDVPEAVDRLLHNELEIADMARKAIDTVQCLKGASQRTMELLRPIVGAHLL